jgi:hypothetical protein
METLLIVFITVTAVAVVIQMGFLVALFFRVNKTSARVETLAAELQTRAIPTLEAVQSMLVEYRPKVDHILEDLVSASTTMKERVVAVDESVGEVVERARLQVARMDELINPGAVVGVAGSCKVAMAKPMTAGLEPVVAAPAPSILPWLAGAALAVGVACIGFCQSQGGGPPAQGRTRQ